MKINKINSSPSFKANLSSEVQKGLVGMAKSTLPTSYAGEKTLKNISAIYNLMSDISLSIKKLNKQNQDFYSFVLSNPKKGLEKEVSFSVKNKKDLFTPANIDNIKWALLDEKAKVLGVKSPSLKNPHIDVFDVKA